VTAAVTLGAALDEAARVLAPSSPTARLDAEVLLMHVLEVGRPALITRASETLGPHRYETYRQLIARRAAGEPVAYITGVREFWSLPVHVAPAVLIPRPETETLVECALARIPRDSACVIADLGTGSGAIALALAHERLHAKVIATDTSPAALEVARGNAHRLRLANIEFRLNEGGGWHAPLAGGRFDVIVSNPPYVRAGDPHLQQGDVRFEPQAALSAGPGGLEAIRQIVAGARARLHQGGWLLLEHGHDQADAVANLLHAAGFSEVLNHRDLAKLPRVTEAR
jgi:release factor glutamine methyltransferase